MSADPIGYGGGDVAMTYNQFKISVIISLMMIFSMCHNCKCQKRDKYIELYDFFEEQQLLAAHSWELNNISLVCIVVQEIEKHENIHLPRRRFIVLRRLESTCTQLFEFGTNDGFITMYLMNDHLLTLWGTGCAFKIRVFFRL